MADSGLGQQRIILGIDPGTLFMGYGLIAVRKNTITLVEMGTLKLARTKDHAERLQLIFEKIQSLILQHRPTAVAIETPFFGKNVQSMLKLGRAQGVAIAAAMVNGLQAAEYAPRKVKQAITGRGNATKEQVLQMLQHTLTLTQDTHYMDATDALAVALCHHYQCQLPAEMLAPQQEGNKPLPKVAKKNNSWAAFAALNPDRIVP